MPDRQQQSLAIVGVQSGCQYHSIWPDCPRKSDKHLMAWPDHCTAMQTMSKQWPYMLTALVQWDQLPGSSPLSLLF